MRRNRHHRTPPFATESAENPAVVDRVVSHELPAGASERMVRLEGVLFIAREPLTSRKLSELADLADGTEARTLIRHLNAGYDRQGRAVRVEQVAGGYQLMTRASVGRWVRRLNHVPPAIRLSQPALETLAVVAYRQPVLRAEVESVRGVACGEVLRQLMERSLVRIMGRSEDLGRPYLYGTTAGFLSAFGLSSLELLPQVAGVSELPDEVIPSGETAS